MVSDLGYKTADYSNRVSHAVCDTGTTVKKIDHYFQVKFSLDILGNMDVAACEYHKITSGCIKILWNLVISRDPSHLLYKNCKV